MPIHLSLIVAHTIFVIYCIITYFSEPILISVNP